MGVRRYHHGGRAGVPERSHLRKHAGVGRVRAHCWRGKTVACVAGIRGRRRRDRLALAARLRGPLPRRRRGRSRSRAGGTGALYVVADRGTVPGRVLLVSVGVGVLGLLQGPPSRAWPRSEAPSARGSCGAASPIRRRPTRRTAEKSVPDPSSSDSQGFLRAPVRHRTTAAGRVLRFRHRRRQYGRRPGRW